MIQRSNRSSLTSAPRRIFSVLVIGWLNLAITPCAMAFEEADDCPHCPPAAEQEMAHHGHDDAGAKSNCASMQTDCCDLAEAALDKRSGKFESQDDVLAIATRVDWPSLQTANTSLRDAPPPDPGDHSPPLHKLFCIYLD